jgi:hypothetical protein
VQGNSQALFGKRPTEKDPAKGTSPAVDFTREGTCGNGLVVTPAPRRRSTSPPCLLSDLIVMPGLAGSIQVVLVACMAYQANLYGIVPDVVFIRLIGLRGSS